MGVLEPVLWNTLERSSHIFYRKDNAISSLKVKAFFDIPIFECRYLVIQKINVLVKMNILNERLCPQNLETFVQNA